MYSEYISEAFGTFVFLVIVLTNGSQPVMIAVGLLIGILLASIASQGHLNPAVSVMTYVNGTNSGDKVVGYIAAQLVAAVLAVKWTDFAGLPKTSIA